MIHFSFTYYGRGMFLPLVRAAFIALWCGEVRMYVDFAKVKDVALCAREAVKDFK